MIFFFQQKMYCILPVSLEGKKLNTGNFMDIFTVYNTDKNEN